MNYQIRHGENFFVPVSELPKGAKLVEEGNGLVVAHSETGHHHILTMENVKDAVLKVFEFEGQTYLDVPLEAKLKHQKEYEAHPTKILQPGFYKKIVQQTYSYAEKAMRKVID